MESEESGTALPVPGTVYHTSNTASWQTTLMCCPCWRETTVLAVTVCERTSATLHDPTYWWLLLASTFELLGNIMSICTGWRKKTGPRYHIENILKIPWPNCVEIGELLQYYMMNIWTYYNMFKNFIALYRHLAKTQLLCDAQIYLYNVNKRQYLCFR